LIDNKEKPFYNKEKPFYAAALDNTGARGQVSVGLDRRLLKKASMKRDEWEGDSEGEAGMEADSVSVSSSSSNQNYYCVSVRSSSSNHCHEEKAVHATERRGEGSRQSLAGATSMAKKDVGSTWRGSGAQREAALQLHQVDSFSTTESVSRVAPLDFLHNRRAGGDLQAGTIEWWGGREEKEGVPMEGEEDEVHTPLADSREVPKRSFADVWSLFKIHAMPSNTQQNTATRYNTLQHTTTQCTTQFC